MNSRGHCFLMWVISLRMVKCQLPLSCSIRHCTVRISNRPVVSKSDRSRYDSAISF